MLPCAIPREIKRALNDLRYQAMTRRTTGPSITRGERLLLRFRRFVTGEQDKQPVPYPFNETAFPPLKAAELASLTEQEFKLFGDPDIQYPTIISFDPAVGPRQEYSATLKQLLELKKKHIAQFREWMGKIETSPGSAKSAGQSS